MSDVVFKQDGTFTRKGDVEEMDVESTSTKVPKKVPEATSSGISDTPTPSKRSKPGTFNLGALRAAAGRTTATGKTTLADSEMQKVGSLADSVKKSQDTAQGAKKAAKKPAKEVHSQKDREGPRTVEKEERKAVLPLVSTEAEAPAARSAEPAPVNLAVTSEESLRADKVQELNIDTLEQKQSGASTPTATTVIKRVSEQSSDRATADTKESSHAKGAAKQGTDVASTPVSGKCEGFTIVAFPDFIAIAGLDENQIAKWCKKCVKESVTSPATVFSYSGNSDIRFYNYFACGSAQTFGAALGHKETLVLVEVNTKTLKVSDISSGVANTGVRVEVNGAPVVYYEERLHHARKV